MRDILEIERDAKFVELFLLVFHIFISEFFETAAFFELGQKRVDLGFECLVATANSHSPLFFLKRFQFCLRGGPDVVANA